MTFVINWHLLDKHIAAKLTLDINNFIKQQKLPDFIGKITLDTLNLGSTAPELQILDICDPPPQHEEKQEDDTKSESSRVSKISFISKQSFQSLRTTPPTLISFLMNEALQRSKDGQSNIIQKRLYPPPTPLQKGVTYKPSRITSKVDHKLSVENLKKHNMMNSKEEKSQKGKDDIDFLGLLGSKGILIKVRFKYDGNALIKVSCEAVANQPTPRLVVLPISVTISHLHVEGLIFYCGQ